tara:strand:+ start:136 stop:594 length:459 start_codon:yes stop_codon:yes gene_type:complete
MSLDLVYRYYSIFIIVYIVLSDILDGYVARKINHVTDLGKILDPVADKISFMTVLIYLINVYGVQFFTFFILLSIRDIILLLFSLYFIFFKDYVPQANNSGKLFIFSCVLMLIFYIYSLNIIIAKIFYIISIILLFISTIYYIKGHLSRMRV